jgi:hypothetical protein
MEDSLLWVGLMPQDRDRVIGVRDHNQAKSPSRPSTG